MIHNKIVENPNWLITNREGNVYMLRDLLYEESRAGSEVPSFTLSEIDKKIKQLNAENRELNAATGKVLEDLDFKKRVFVIFNMVVRW